MNSTHAGVCIGCRVPAGHVQFNLAFPQSALKFVTVGSICKDLNIHLMDSLNSC